MFYLGQSYLGQFLLRPVLLWPGSRFYLGQFYLGHFHLGQVYLGQVRLTSIRLRPVGPNRRLFLCVSAVCVCVSAVCMCLLCVLVQDLCAPPDPPPLRRTLPPPDRPKFRSFFFLLLPPFSLLFFFSLSLLGSFFLSLGIFSCLFFSLRVSSRVFFPLSGGHLVEFWWCFGRSGPTKTPPKFLASLISVRLEPTFILCTTSLSLHRHGHHGAQETQNLQTVVQLSVSRPTALELPSRVTKSHPMSREIRSGHPPCSSHVDRSSLCPPFRVSARSDLCVQLHCRQLINLVHEELFSTFPLGRSLLLVPRLQVALDFPIIPLSHHRLQMFHSFHQVCQFFLWVQLRCSTVQLSSW